MIPERIRADFPLYEGEDPPLHFDNACMTLKPRPVIDAVRRYYEETPFCAGRSTHRQAALVEQEVDAARNAAARFIHARSASECVFLRNTTEAINVVAHGLQLPPGTTVLTTDREHNSNLVPWQRLAGRSIQHEAIASAPDETVDLDAFERRLAEGGVGLVSVVHASNLDGYVTPLRQLCELAHEHDVPVLADGAQHVPHHPTSVRNLGVDLYAFSAHKMMGPTGVGVLWGRDELLDAIEPLSAGGQTIEDTTYTEHTFRRAPHKFEGGLQDYAGIVALRAAVEYLERLGMEDLHQHEEALSQRLEKGLEDVGATFIGAAEGRGNGIVSFAMENAEPHELAILFEDKANALVRAGYHCLNSWFHARGLPGSCRASLYAYNTEAEVDAFLTVAEELSGALKRAS